MYWVHIDLARSQFPKEANSTLFRLEEGGSESDEGKRNGIHQQRVLKNHKYTIWWIWTNFKSSLANPGWSEALDRTRKFLFPPQSFCSVFGCVSCRTVGSAACAAHVWAAEGVRAATGAATAAATGGRTREGTSKGPPETCRHTDTSTGRASNRESWSKYLATYFFSKGKQSFLVLYSSFCAWINAECFNL